MQYTHTHSHRLTHTHTHSLVLQISFDWLSSPQAHWICQLGKWQQVNREYNQWKAKYVTNGMHLICQWISECTHECISECRWILQVWYALHFIWNSWMSALMSIFISASEYCVIIFEINNWMYTWMHWSVQMNSNMLVQHMHSKFNEYVNTRLSVFMNANKVVWPNKWITSQKHSRLGKAWSRKMLIV